MSQPMRLNQYLAAATHLSRRSADEAISEDRVTVNGNPATLGQVVGEKDQVSLDGSPVFTKSLEYILFNKPVGYVCSKIQQDENPTLYELLPQELHHLNTVGRLDKDSSGLIVLTNDGELTQKLAHPTSGKWKQYELILHKKVSDEAIARIKAGVELEDGMSRMEIISYKGANMTVRLQEGRNRQIRRTFTALDYAVKSLRRTHFGKASIGNLEPGQYKQVVQGDLI